MLNKLRRCGLFSPTGMLSLLLSGLLVLLPVRGVVAGAGTAGASFLKIGAGARPVSMGEAYVAIADDGYGMYWNPAGMQQVERGRVTASRHEQLFNIKNDLMAGVVPLGQDQTLGFSSRLLHREEQRRSEFSSSGSYTNYYGSLASYYSRSFTNQLNAGVGMNLIQAQLADEQAQTIAFDGGLHYRAPVTPLRLGLVVQNLGPGITFIKESDPLPLTIRAGWAYDMKIFEKMLTFSNDVVFNQPENITSMHLGAEYDFYRYAQFRLGYKTPQDFDSRPSFSTGFGFQYQGITLDYSFTTRSNELDDKHRVSLTVPFGTERSVAPSPFERNKRSKLISSYNPEDWDQYPEEVQEFNRKGFEEFEIGDFDQAIKYWENSLQQVAPQPQLYPALGMAHLELGEIEQAEWYLQRLPEETGPAESEEADREPEQSISEIISSYNPENWDEFSEQVQSLNRRGFEAFEQRNFEQAVELWENSLRQRAGQRQLYPALARAHLELGENRKASWYEERSP